MKTRTSLVIATYNWPEALELVLLSVLNQSILPNDILIADDGSTQATKQLINNYSNKFQSGINHIWQEDKGFQKTSILNKAVAEANGDYIIQIDGDIVLHKHFISDHLSNAKKDNFIHGSRAFLSTTKTQQSITNANIDFSFFEKGMKNRMNCLRSNFLSFFFSTANKGLKGTRGCNFSFWKQDFINVNGYNEDMTGWGKEDTELSVRLMNSGLKKYKLKYLAICYHLHHNTASKEGLNINNLILAETISRKKTSCSNGINKYVVGNK